MEDETVTLALTVAQWRSILNVLGSAPYVMVTSNADAVNAIHSQANAQVEEIQKKYPQETPVEQ